MGNQTNNFHSMLILNTAQNKLAIDDLCIVFLFNEDDCERFSAEVNKLNLSQAFTCDLYTFKIKTMRGRANDQISLKELRDAIENHNVVIPLFKDNNGNFIYAFDNIDLSTDVTEWRRRVHDLVIEITRRNIDIVNAHIAGKKALPNQNAEELATEKEVLKILEQSVAESEVNYNLYLCERAPRLFIGRLTTTHYRKSVQRYGVMATINNEQIPIFFKDIDQKMLFITALMRYKIGSPLYLRELFNNSRHSRINPKLKPKVEQWFIDVYNTIIDMDRKNAQEWLKKIYSASKKKSEEEKKDEKIQYRSNPLYQAKSDANRCVNKSLKFYPTYKGYCLLKTETDSNNDTFYTFTCPRENISVDDDLQRLIDRFVSLHPTLR